MILYHGSFLEIAKPDLVHSRPNVDFGRGFYVTPLYEQAAKWCGKFKRRGKDGIISRYEYDESLGINNKNSTENQNYISIKVLYYIMVLNFINILLQCISAYIILPH